jgi:hypothetical protein
MHDAGTAPVLLKLYPGLTGKDEIKAMILKTLPLVDKEKGFDNYMDLLTTGAPLQTENSNRVFRPLSDSLSLALVNWKRILPLIRNSEYRFDVLDLANSAANNKEGQYDNLLQESYGNLTEFAFSDLDRYLALKDSAENPVSGIVYRYMQFMSTIKNPDFAEKFTKAYLAQDPHGYYAVDAVVARMENKLSNNPGIVTPLLDSLGTRYQLLEVYNKLDLLKDVPSKYRTQGEFARLNLYQHILENDETAGEITLLGTVSDSGKTYYAFKYDLADAEEQASYLGICGPYEPKSEKLDFTNNPAYTNFDPLKDDWKTQALELVADSKR